ncbi:MAG: NAD(P)-dependent oxidoreductase [Dehalobacterium sp.]
MEIKKVGFIGLGNMGRPMALNLIKKGYKLVVTDLRTDVLDEFVGLGAIAVDSAKEVGSVSDVIITMLPSSPDVEMVALGKNGLIEGIKSGSVLIDMSTIDPITTKKVAEKLCDKEARMIDAPVTRGVQAAVEGTLTIMVGGELDTFEECKSVLSAMGEKIYYIGDIGSGEVVKIINNMIIGANVAACAEGLALGAKYGINVNKLVEVLESGTANSVALQNHMKKHPLKKGREKGIFPVTYIMKDLDLALVIGKNLGVPLTFGATAYQAYAWMKAFGRGDDYYPGILSVYEDLLNIKVRLEVEENVLSFV